MQNGKGEKNCEAKGGHQEISVMARRAQLEFGAYY